MKPHTSYIICATQRSGSHLLAEALEITGIAGRPREYFWDESAWLQRWGLSVSSYADYLSQVIEHGTTPNGVFGATLMGSYFSNVISKLKRLPGMEVKSQVSGDLLKSAFPNLHYIWLTRNDRVRQAISYWKALQTDVWCQTTEELPIPIQEPIFSFESIDSFVQGITIYERNWQHYFDRCGIQPVRVFYEELVSAYEAAAHRILRNLKIAGADPVVFAERRLKKQADAVSEEWFQRYHQFKQSQSPH